MNLVKKILADELGWRTSMNDIEIEMFVDAFIKILDNKRLILAPTFLLDRMYEAQKNCIPDMQYEKANQLYKTALEELQKASASVSTEDYLEGR